MSNDFKAKFLVKHEINLDEHQLASHEVILEMKIEYLLNKIENLKLQHQSELASYDYRNSQRIKDYTQVVMDKINQDLKVQLFNFFEEMQTMRLEKQANNIRLREMESQMIQLNLNLTEVKTWANWDQIMHE